MDNLIHHVENGKMIVINLNAVCKFRESADVTPKVEVSYANNPDYFITIPYLWKDFLKNFYPQK